MAPDPPTILLTEISTCSLTSVIHDVAGRPNVSLPPPGLKGTTIDTFCEGDQEDSSAWAVLANVAEPNAKATAMVPPICRKLLRFVVIVMVVLPICL